MKKIYKTVLKFKRSLFKRKAAISVHLNNLGVAAYVAPFMDLMGWDLTLNSLLMLIIGVLLTYISQTLK